MIPIFLIHDKEREDRKKLFTKEFNEQDIHEWYVIDAVKTHKNRAINVAEAHKTCVQRAVASDLERVVIMEDDVAFVAPGAYKRFLGLAGEIPEDWDILISGSYDYKIQNTDFTGMPIVWPDKAKYVGLDKFSGLHCYMINKNYYQTFLDTDPKNNLDKQLTGNIYMAWPQLALQHDGLSDRRGMLTRYNETHKHNLKLWTNG